MRISVGAITQFSVVLSTLAVHQLSELPAWLLTALIGVCVCSVLALFTANRLLRRLRSLEMCLIVLFFSAAQASLVTYRAQDRLLALVPASQEGMNTRLIGIVDSLPAPYERGVSFTLFVEQCVSEQTWCPKGRLVKLSWFNGAPQELMPGQRWELTARLRRPHARMNPNLFDAELRMFEQAITAQGSVRVREQTPALLLGDLVGSFQGAPWLVERARYHLRQRIETATASRSYYLFSTAEQQVDDVAKIRPAVSGVLIALVVGDQGAVASTWWGIFNQTGVGHLMSISGLHVTMMAGFSASIAVGVWSLLILFLSKFGLSGYLDRIPSKQLTRWCAGVAGAWAYTALAGFGIPAQRTCWMVTLAALAMLGGRSGSAGSVILFTASAITLIDPWAVLSAGFWLSFGAVSAIIYFGSAKQFTNRHSKPPLNEPIAIGAAIKKWFLKVASNGWQSQIAATISLLPIGAAFFSSFALLSPIANAVAIPLVSVLVTPMAIVGAMLSYGGANVIGDEVLWFGAAITAPLLQWLHWLASLPGSVAILGKPEVAPLWLGVFAMAWLLAPYRMVSWKLRICGLLALMPIVLQTPQAPKLGEVWLTTFDVGQGSAVLIETKNRRLLFDLGPSYGAQANAGSAVIAPYVRARGFKSVDALILSHYDADHMAGLNEVLRSTEVNWIASSVPQSESIWQISKNSSKKESLKTLKFFDCQRGDFWDWDGVRFEFLHPDQRDRKRTIDKSNAAYGTKANGNSCVLKVSVGGVSALLTGDIEMSDERKLIQTQIGSRLKAEVLFVPNHGSKSSSSQAFIDAVAPKIAVFQIGFRNRFRYPDSNVIQRYSNHGASILRTDELGAISIRLPSLDFAAERSDTAPYWRTRLGASSRSQNLMDD
jgi:competence protein ComEC